MIDDHWCLMSIYILFGFVLGLDLDCGIYYTNYTLPAIQKSRVQEKEVDKALVNLYLVLMRLGYFDGSPGNLDSLGKHDICKKEHIELAIDAAREGIVLLKNNGSTLPLKHTNIKKIAVVGPHANATDALVGNYAGIYEYLTSSHDPSGSDPTHNHLYDIEH